MARNKVRAVRLALQIAVVMREIFRREGEVGIAQEGLVLVAMRIEGGGDDGVPPDRLPHAARDLRLGARHAANAHGAVDGKVDAVDRRRGLQSAIIVPTKRSNAASTIQPEPQPVPVLGQ